MEAKVNRFFARTRITPAIAWSISGTLLSGLTGPIVALLIAQRFSPEMQGYYYTFNSLLAMSVFLELGFNGCIVQFISHEYAHLGMRNGMLNDASPKILGRLASLVRMSLQWYAIAGILLLVGVGMGGELFFKYNSPVDIVNWRGPWWFLCALSALNLMSLPLTALLDGCDQVNWTARAKIFQNLGRSLVLIAGLLFGLGLYAPAVSALVGLLIFLVQFNIEWRRLLRQVVTCRVDEGVLWLREIFPVQWRITLSWVSGYFIFSSFNPILFAHSGAKVAGQFGMTWAILTAINSMSQAFVATRGPKFGTLIAKCDWFGLRRIWLLALGQSMLLSVIGMAALLSVVIILHELDFYAVDRLLGINVLVPLCIAGLVNQFVFCVAIVVRAEKREPFVWVSVVVAVVVFVGSLLTVDYFSVGGLVYSYLLGALIGLYFSIKIYRRAAVSVGRAYGVL